MKTANQLLKSRSAYLRLHAYDPVDWHLYTEENIERAQKLDKPILLHVGSFGSSDCYDFEKNVLQDIEIAERINEVFFPIKVDAAVSPELCALYSDLAQLMSAGQSYLPLIVALDHELQPFCVAIYVPGSSNVGDGALEAMYECIEIVESLWPEEKEHVIVQSSSIVASYKESVKEVACADDERPLPGPMLIDTAVERLLLLADPLSWGIVSEQRKSPMVATAQLALRYASVHRDPRPLFFVSRSYTAMAYGAIYDHLEGGFFSYSEAPSWNCPDFFKGLNTQAALLITCTQLWQMTKKRLWVDLCQETTRFINDELACEEGGFYHGCGAISIDEGTEYFGWSFDELSSILGEEKASLFADAYGIRAKKTNAGRELLSLAQPLDEFFADFGVDKKEAMQTISAAKKQLLDIRQKREGFFREETVICSANAQAAHAFIKVGLILGDEALIEKAQETLEMIFSTFWKEGHLIHCVESKASATTHWGQLHDYATTMLACLALFEAGRGFLWLVRTIELAEVVEREFQGGEGAYYVTDGLNSGLLCERFGLLDNETPSANALLCEAFLKLYQITRRAEYRDRAQGILASVSKVVEQYPLGYCAHLLNTHAFYQLAKAPQFVISLSTKNLAAQRQEILTQLSRRYMPLSTIIWRNDEADKDGLLQWTAAAMKGLTVWLDGKMIASYSDLHKILDCISEA